MLLCRKKEDRSKWTRREQNKQRKNHTNSPLHKWCTNHFAKIKKEEEATKDREVKASEKIVENAVFCLKQSQSGKDFIRLNDKDQLNSNSFPTKNDGMQSFFEIRNIVYEELSEIARNRLKCLKNASFSLDKVTIKSIPYTVLVTYYFWEGEIHIFLNSIHQMKSSEYSAESTAEMIGRDMMTSLGMTREEIRTVFVHAVYDGVYATKEERTKGGGSLSLKTHFAKWCGQDEGKFSGSWDLGHLLQLVYGDTYKEHKDIQDFNKKMYRIMNDWKSGLSGVRFRELAEELNHAVLTNKGQQETRWARAEIRSIQALLRNLPTFATMYGSEEEVCRKNGDIAGQKENQRNREAVCDQDFITFAVGLAQILELYAKCSLDVQNVKLQPSSAPGVSRELQKSLEELTEWKWQDKDLKFSGIGNPGQIIQDLTNGHFKQHLSSGARMETAKRRNIVIRNEADIARKLSELGEVDISPDDCEENLLEKDDIDQGEIAVEFSEEKLHHTELKLQEIVSSILESLETRVQIPEDLKLAEEMFENIEWYEKLKDDKTIGEKLLKLISKMNTQRTDEFEENAGEIIDGYKIYLHHTSHEKMRDNYTTLANNYKKFCRLYSDIESTKAFQDFYEHINIRSYSEAVCETIGSIMGISVANGRNLMPLYLHKEVFIRYNLPPFHVLKDKFIPKVAETWRKRNVSEKGFFRKLPKRSGLQLSEVSHSLEAFRKAEEERSHFPVDLFNGKN